MAQRNPSTLEYEKMTDVEVDAMVKNWKIAEIIRWIIMIGFVAGMYLAGFETSSHAEETYVTDKVFQEHAKAQDQTMKEIRDQLRDLNNYLRTNKR